MVIKIKKKKKSKDKKNTIKKLFFTASIATIFFMVVLTNLARIIFVHGKEYSESAYNQQMKNQIISPKRGIIYDANGNILARSVAVDTISMNPGKVAYANGNAVENEVIATGLSETLGVDYNEVLNKITSDSSVVVIAKKIDQEKTKN